MTDRELIVLSAEAAGYTLTKGSSNYREFMCRGGVEWNPLTRDGDALRLAASLCLDIVFAHDEVCVNWVSKTDCEYFEEPYGDDRMAATRRAITRAAAEIGRLMK